MKALNGGELKLSIKMGSLVRVLDGLVNLNEHPKDVMGIVTDVIELDDGFPNYEVVWGGNRGWFSDLQLEALSDPDLDEFGKGLVDI